MRQPCHPEAKQIVCFESCTLAQDEEQTDENYAACLTEDVQLFGQLDDLVGHSELDELLNMTQTQLPIKVECTQAKRKRAPPTKRQSIYICDVCERCFSDAYSLRIHKMIHTDEKPHVCTVCGKGFRQMNKLRIHSVTHTDKKPHQCDICGKGFRFANYLTVHRRLHTGEKPYPCTMSNCKLFFHSIHARRMHIKLQHATNSGEEADLQSIECHAEQQEELIKTNVSNTNGAVKSSLSYTCPICGRILTDQCYLNTHLKRHYNQRDFPCLHPKCGKKFFSSSELNHHQIAHTRLRPFQCTKCGSCFLRKSNYKQHLKLHNAKK